MDKLFQNSMGVEGEHPPRQTLLLYVDGELAPKEASQVQAHLEACWHCRVEIKRIEETIAEITDFDERLLKPYIVPPRRWADFTRQFDQLVAERSNISFASKFFGLLRRFFSHLRPVGGARLRLKVAGGLLGILISGLIVILIFDREPSVSASELLLRAAEAQATELSKTEQPVVYQKLQVWRRDNRSSARDQAVSLEIWNDAAHSRSRQSVTGESGRRFLPTATSVESDGRETSGAPQVLIELERILRANHMDPERPLSPGSYQAWRNSLRQKREEVRKSNLAGGDQALTLRTITGGQVEIGRITEAALVVRARDWHPRELRLRVRAEDGEREYGMVETDFEVVGLSTLSAEIFPTESSNRSNQTGQIGPLLAVDTSAATKTDSAQALPPRVVATAELEVEALRLLNQAGADMGEQVSVKRGSDMLLWIEGIVETDARKAEILHALEPLLSNTAVRPAVRIDIKTVFEAVAEQRRQGKQSSSPPTERRAEVMSGTMAAESDLRSYFNSADEARRFAARMVSRSQQAMRHLYALKRLASRFSAEELKELSPDASNKWLALVRTHARAFRQEVSELRQELKPIFSPPALGSSLPDGPQIYDTASVIQAIERLFELGSANERVVLSAFTISSDGTNVTAIKTPQFWQSLQASEALAVRIQAVL
jgi:Putative zinc-finger